MVSDDSLACWTTVIELDELPSVVVVVVVVVSLPSHIIDEDDKD